ncbi:MAG: TrkH family potassium uptake protein [Megasphaera sp.]|jgi:trk system potassium uptake protein TrkH|nr:TrkH family potassium uptake protein [Megasphaera sp.]MCH4187553.1 TrkH family potassium uptake protein [Megasphaera sp.]MCH4217902.1 TrkH family potassium uptake protein [Megasphaera sp.]
MDFRVISHFLGEISFAQGGVFFLPLVMALWFGEECIWCFVLTIGICALTAWILLYYGAKRTAKLTIREGIAITAFGWFLATLLGMLPYVIGGYLGLLDGIFESISGFTGTGATVITDIEALPQSILLWRSMTHWLGGLGIVVIFIALLPEAGQSSVYMYNAESTGPTRERVLPRLQDMIKALFRIYMAFTGVAFIVFILCGMDFISAVNHAMSVCAAGGFSTFNASAAHFNSVAVEMWMTFFMVLVGGNFGLYFQVWRKGIGVLKKNTEFKAYLLVLAIATILNGADLIEYYGISAATAFRYAAFQVASVSTTGFVSADYDQWPSFSKIILMFLMISGGCAGSTAAGVKISRLVILVKAVRAVIDEKLHPRMIREVTMNGVAVGESTIIRVSLFFFMYIMFIVLWAVLLTWDGIAIFDAVGISVTTMGCIGPSFGITGATCTYAGLSSFAKTILCISMLLGRLEMFTILVMLQRRFWKRNSMW